MRALAATVALTAVLSIVSIAHAGTTQPAVPASQHHLSSECGNAVADGLGARW